MKRGTSLVNAALQADQPPDPQAAQWVEQAIEAYQEVLQLKPDPQQYGIPVEDVARLGLANAYRLQGTIFLLRGNVDSALQDFVNAIELLEASRPVFEASVADHESYRRYLAQTYEYLGITYQWQASTFEKAQNYDAALSSYQKSLDAFNQCVRQGEVSPDLIVQNDIVANVCLPKLAEVQQTYNELNGGQ
jgi:tetratricopeptide (TPR) repeat protein